MHSQLPRFLVLLMGQTHCPLQAVMDSRCAVCGHHPDKLPVKHRCLTANRPSQNVLKRTCIGVETSSKLSTSVDRSSSCLLIRYCKCMLHFIKCPLQYLHYRLIYKASLRLLETHKLWEMLLMSSFRPTYKPDSHRVTEGTSRHVLI